MALLTDTWYVAKRELIKFLRTKVRVVVTLVQPILWLGLMGNMMGKVFDNPYVAQAMGVSNYMAFMTPGIIIMTVLFGGVFGGISIVWDRRVGYLEKLLAAPIHRGAIPFGKTLAVMIQNGIQVLAIVGIASAFGVRFETGFAGILGLMVVAMFFGAILSSISLSLAASIKTMETLMAIVNFLTMPLMFTSNALFPREAMPNWLAAIARINPVTYAVGPIRELVLHGWDWSKILPGFAVIVGLAILFMLISQMIFQQATTD